MEALLSRRNMRRRVQSAIQTVLRAALYLRRSTNEELQHDSLVIQEQILRAFAQRLGIIVVRIFAESGSGRTDDRKEFRRLIDEVTSGSAAFDVILVRDVSRWGRFDNIDESAYYEFLCLRHGVGVLYAEEGFDASPYGAIQKMMKRFMAAEFSREKARIITRGKHHTATHGFRPGAPAPYGMKRILVDRAGTPLQDLPRGVHKIVSNLKVKLAPSDDATAAIVVRMFRMFVEDRSSSAASIARMLNKENVTSSRGHRWSAGMVRYLLSNEAYAGTAVHRTWGGETIRIEHAHAALLTPELFAAAQARRAELAHHSSSREALIAEAREAVAKYGHLPANVADWFLRRTRHPTRPRFSDVMAHAFETSIAAAKLEIIHLVERHFDVEPQPDGLLIDGSIAVRWVAGFVRRDLVRRPARFTFTTDEWDVAICLAVDPETNGVVARCFVLRERLRGRRSLVWNVVANTRKTALTPINNGRYLTRCLSRLLSRAAQEAKFLANVGAAEQVTIAALERKLGVSAAEVKITAQRLAEAGAITAGSIGRKASPRGTLVTVTCPVCGLVRAMRPSEAAARRTGRCRNCRNKREKKKLSAVCPACGAVREVWPCVAKVMKDGLAALCHSCALSLGRAKTAERRRAQQPYLEAKYGLLRQLALVVCHAMLQRPRQYVRPCLWSAERCRLATLRWRSPIDGVANRLTLDCGSDLVERCATVSSVGDGPLLADRILDPTTWVPLEPRAGDRRWLVVLS